jgi:hypothetical protein
LLYCFTKQPASATPDFTMHAAHTFNIDGGSDDSTHDDGNQLSLKLRVDFYLNTAYPTRGDACTAVRYSSTLQEKLATNMALAGLMSIFAARHS